MEKIGKIKSFVSALSLIHIISGIIIGVSLIKLISVFTSDIFIPFLSYLCGIDNLINLKFIINEHFEIRYGILIQFVFELLFFVFIIWIIIKIYFKKKKAV